MNSVTYHVVFKIDNVLCEGSILDSRKKKLLKKKGGVVNALIPFYLYPGVKEVIKILSEMNDVRIAFYSAGSEQRNKIFVKELLKTSLGYESYQKIKKNVKIFSNRKSDGSSDLIFLKEEQNILQKERFGQTLQGNYKKDLNLVVQDKSELNYSVIIDDVANIITSEQEPNLLLFPFNTKNYEIREYSEFITLDNGLLQIPIKFVDKQYNTQHSVIRAEYIALYFENEKFVLGYLDKDQKNYKELEISLEDFPSLNKFYDQKESDQKIEKELLIQLYELLEVNDGKTTIVDQKSNAFCYAAGVLFKAIEYSKSNSSTLTEFLFPLHFIKNKDDQNFSPRYATLNEISNASRDEFYLYGLKKIQEINPSFTFINPKIYQEILNDEE